MINSIKHALETVQGLSNPSKMPCHGYSIPASRCITGSKLAEIAGTICNQCYASKGMYRFSNVQDALERRFQSLSHPDWVESMTFLINKKKMQFFRWHDSGDIQSFSHLRKIALVCIHTPQTKHWLPTRETKIVKEYLSKYGKFPSNLVVRISAMSFDKKAPDGFAKKYGLCVSGASSNGSHTCPAYKQENACKDCRACWDQSVFSVDYKKH